MDKFDAKLTIERSTSKEFSLWYSKETDLFSLNSGGDKKLGLWLSAPFSVCMEIGRYCNFQCQICISESSPQHEPNDDWVAKGLQNISSAFGPIRAVWSGGEPTIYPNIEHYIEQSKALGNINILVTNGSRFVEDLQADWIDVSIYGHSKTSFQTYTGSSQFEKFKKNLILYASKYPRVSASFILGVYGRTALTDMVQLALDAGVRRLKFHRLSLVGRNVKRLCGDSIDSEIAEMQEYLAGLPVHASYTRTKSSEHKRRGYWVAKSPGMLTNSETSVYLESITELRDVVVKYSSENRCLFN